MLDDEIRKEMLRERIAKENAFQLYKRYSEKHAADMIGCDYSTLKRKRRAGLVPFVDIAAARSPTWDITSPISSPSE